MSAITPLAKGWAAPPSARSQTWASFTRDMGFTTQAEHHRMPSYGKAHVAYRPVERVVGLSKLARLVDVYAQRLQTQEQLTSQVAATIEDVLKPHGGAVLISAA